jgi:hypothetical protein
VRIVAAQWFFSSGVSELTPSSFSCSFSWKSPAVTAYNRAVSRLAFVLWLRIDEALTLKYEDVSRIEQTDGGECRIIKLRFRKTHQVIICLFIASKSNADRD